MRETQESQKDLDKQVEKRGCVLPVFDPFEHQLESLRKDTLPGAGNDISQTCVMKFICGFFSHLIFLNV